MQEFKTRREALLEKMQNTGVAILPGGLAQYRNGDVEYPFRQDSHFYYLSGFCEEDAVFVLIKNSEKRSEFLLFCHQPNEEEDRWTGPRLSLNEVAEEFKVDKVFALGELDQVMPGLLKDKTHLYFNGERYPAFNQRLMKWIKDSSTVVWHDLLSLIGHLRIIKSPFEIKLISTAVEISVAAHKRLMENVRPNRLESSLEGEFIASCFDVGCRAMAYPTIVAGGARACTLHYTQNSHLLKEGDLVLVDGGCEYQYYASDITRTYPVSRRFSIPQRMIYELVLSTQLAAIEILKPGLPWHKIEETVQLNLVSGLVDLGFLKGNVSQLIADKAHRKFYMHSASHWLGLDVHDAGSYKEGKESRTLKPGMVFTIEPGIYISPGEPGIEERFWGIGIRIEDDILVTETGCKVLSKDLPKTVHELESYLGTET